MGQIDRLRCLQRPIARHFRGNIEGQLLALAVKDVLAGRRIGYDLALQLRRQVDERAGDAQAGRPGDDPDLLDAIGKGLHVETKSINQIQIRIGRKHDPPDDIG